MKTIIAVQKIDITSLLNNRILEVEQRNKEQNYIKQERIEKLTPYIAQAMFGMVEIHNKLVELKSDKKFLNREHIEDAHEFVNTFINNTTNWNINKYEIGSPYYKNVNFKFASLNIWLNDNYGAMRYTRNPIYQIYGAYDVEEFLADLIKKVI